MRRTRPGRDRSEMDRWKGRATCQDESSSPSRSPSPARAWSARRAGEVVANPEDRVLSADELRDRVAGCEAVLCLLTDPVDASVLEAAAAGGCRVFANMAVGYNNIDVAAATRLGIVVTNTPGVLTEATADLTWALILAVARRVVEGDAEMRGGPVPRLGAAVHARRRRDAAGPSAWSGRAGSPRPSPSAPGGSGCPCSTTAAGRARALEALGARRVALDDAARRERLRQPARPALGRDPAPDRRAGPGPDEADGLPDQHGAGPGRRRGGAGRGAPRGADRRGRA